MEGGEGNFRAAGIFFSSTNSLYEVVLVKRNTEKKNFD